MNTFSKIEVTNVSNIYIYTYIRKKKKERNGTKQYNEQRSAEARYWPAH